MGFLACRLATAMATIYLMKTGVFIGHVTAQILNIYWRKQGVLPLYLHFVTIMHFGI